METWARTPRDSIAHAIHKRRVREKAVEIANREKAVEIAKIHHDIAELSREDEELKNLAASYVLFCP